MSVVSAARTGGRLPPRRYKRAGSIVGAHLPGLLIRRGSTIGLFGSHACRLVEVERHTFIRTECQLWWQDKGPPVSN